MIDTDLEALGTIKLSSMQKVIDEANKYYKEQNIADPDLPVTFVLSAIFPDTYDNLKSIVTHKFVEGYKEGYRAALEENK